MLELQFTPFPVIETERLLLREITLHDAPELFKLRTDVNAMKYLGRPLATMDSIHSLINTIQENVKTNNAINWGIGLKNSDKIFGNIGYHQVYKEHHRAEIGYMIMPDYWRKGYTDEAIKAVIHYGFTNMKLHSIEANVNPGNIASSGLLEKNKFKLEGYFRENYFYNGNFTDSENIFVAIYGLILHKLQPAYNLMPCYTLMLWCFKPLRK